MIVADVDFGSFPCAFPTKINKPEHTETMELGPNAEMTLAQDESMAVVEVSHRLESLDMNPTPEDAYEKAVIASAQESTPSSTVDDSVAALTTHAPAPTVVTNDHYRQFLELLYTRFTQTVAPLPKSITKSFNTPPPRATLQEVDADGTAKEPSSTPLNPSSSSSTVTRSTKSPLSYVPSSRTYSKPTNPARRRTTSAPPQGAAPNLSVVRRQVASTFDDLGSMIKVAGDMMDYMRSDMEEVMKRRRRRAREENHQMDTSDEDEPLTRKVPVAKSAPWYSATGAPQSQDPSLSANHHSTERKFITPKRLRSRLSSTLTPLATIPESTEPGEQVSNDAIERCTSRFTTLKLDDMPKVVTVQPTAVAPAVSKTPLLASNPIRLYVGYNRDCTVRSSFVFGSDMVSTPSTYNPTSYEIVI